MSSNSGKMHTTIRLTVVSVFIVATALTAVVAIGLQYYFSEKMAREAAADLYSATATSVASELNAIGRVNANIIDLLADNPDLGDPDREAALIKIFVQVLEKNPLLYGIYVGRSDGSLFEVINLNTSDQARNKMLALPPDEWLVMIVRSVDGAQQRSYQYLDANLQERVSRSESTDYDAAQRPWYQAALLSGEVEVSKPYLFAQLGSAGRTVSKRIVGSDSVVGIDMTLASISKFLSDQQIAGDSGVYLYDAEGNVIASNFIEESKQPALPIPNVQISQQERDYLDSLGTLTVSNELNWPPIDYAQRGEPRGYSVDIVRMIAGALDVPVAFENGFTWSELVDRFREGKIKLLHPVALTEENRDWGRSGDSHFRLPFALVTKEGAEQPVSLNQLIGKNLAIPKGWSVLDPIRKAWPNINIVEADSTLDAIEQVIAGDVEAALDNETILRYIAQHYFMSGLAFHTDLDLGLDNVPDQFFILSPDAEPELRILLDRAIDAFEDEHHNYLEETWLNAQQSGGQLDSETVPSGKMIEIAADPDQHGQLISIDIDGEENVVFASATGSGVTPLYLGIVTPVSVVLEPFLSNISLSLGITAGLLFLLLPLSWLFANPIVRPVRQLAVENDKVRRLEFDEVQRVSSSVKELDELSESMVDMVASIQAHEIAQRDLMDAFIRLIAQAIDDKSPYTGGHCERVPELALMLADAATQCTEPAFQDFALKDDEEWREYRIAAWLHDCGKITTPEHIVDKGSKLETIYNRIHEIRTRFEVLSRDAEIHYWESLASSPEKKQILEAELERVQKELQDDFEFVAECNVGGEFLDESKQQRLLEIAEKTWQRRFNDQLGLSPVEELRHTAEPTPVPAVEKLLADRPDHIIERTRSTDYDPKLGINMDVPVHLYNQGEIYNLSISRGTLTAEDRFKINEHMISTIKMLESLPFPEELKNVPRYASTHHETMRGSGYPRKLPGDQLSIPERILAVADVFEALTASDRPYKKAKPVSVAVDILSKMVDDNHIDRDCFELFIKEGIYLKYAQEFLDPGQVDAVDVQKYVS